VTGHLKPGRVPGTWYLRVEAPRRSDGKRDQPRETFRGTKGEAQRRLRELLCQVESDGYADAGRMTIAEVCTRWLEATEHRVAARTFEFYSALVQGYVVPELGLKKAKSLRPVHVEAALAKWISGKRKDKVKGRLSPRTVKHILGTLKAACRWAVRMGLLTRNPADAVMPPRVERLEMKALDAAGVTALLAAAEGLEIQLPILVAIGTGLRRGELLGLRWNDIDFNDCRLSVRRSLEVVASEIRSKPPKTTRSARTISLASFVVEALRRHRVDQNRRRSLSELGGDDEAWVFSDIRGNPLNPIHFTKRFGRLVRQPDVPKVRFHDLRHSHATLSLAAGIDLKTISASLGHSTISITANTYLHAVDSLQRESANRLDAALRDAVGAGLSRRPVPQRCHAGPLAKKKARRSGLSMVAGPGFEPGTFGL
jgi:integrase